MTPERRNEIPLRGVVIQPAEPGSPLRMFGVDYHGDLWSRVKGSAGWGEWGREQNPLRDLDGK